MKNIKRATQELCKCNEEQAEVIYINSVNPNHEEIESIEIYYCVTCNCTWNEI